MLTKDKPPKCEDCGRASELHPYQRENGIGYEWLCGSCKVLRMNPEATRAVSLPREMKPLPLQRETLF